jgi:hypothetical protein
VKLRGKTPVSQQPSAIRPASALFYSWGTPTGAGEKWQEKTPTKGLSFCRDLDGFEGFEKTPTKGLSFCHGKTPVSQQPSAIRPASALFYSWGTPTGAEKK